jgi:hypothetical protein
MLLITGVTFCTQNKPEVNAVWQLIYGTLCALEIKYGET